MGINKNITPKDLDDLNERYGVINKGINSIKTHPLTNR